MSPNQKNEKEEILKPAKDKRSRQGHLAPLQRVAESALLAWVKVFENSDILWAISGPVCTRWFHPFRRVGDNEDGPKNVGEGRRR